MRYDNTRREVSARATRLRVIDAARASFLSRGFGGTTIRRVAEDAGVSQETVYKTFGSKAALLKAVYDVTLVGDDEQIPLAQRPEAIAVKDAATPAEAARAYAELASAISLRIDPLVRLIQRSRGADTTLAQIATTIEGERHAGSGFYVRRWEGTGWLRDDITLETAIDTLYALNSPEPRWLLIERGWSEEHFTRWLGDMIGHALFDVSAG